MVEVAVEITKVFMYTAFRPVIAKAVTMQCLCNFLPVDVVCRKFYNLI